MKRNNDSKIKSANSTSAGEGKKFFPAFIFLLLISIGLNGVYAYQIPDFAFPATVSEQSDSLLDQALKKRDDLISLRYALDIVIANSEIANSDNALPAVNLLDSVRNCMQPPYSQLATLLQAQILTDAYLDNRYLFEQRNLPIEQPYPSDTQEWSAQMFKKRILHLLEKATAHIPLDSSESSENEQKTIGIENISILLVDYQTAQKIGMTVDDFIAFKAVDLLKNFIREDFATEIPFFPTQANNTDEGKAEQLSKNLLQNLIDKQGNSVIKALAVKEMYIILPDADKESYLKEALENFKDTEGEGILLYEAWKRVFGKSSRPRSLETLYVGINSWLDRFPDGFCHENLRYALTEISEQKIDVTLPNLCLTDSDIKGVANITNLSKAYLLIYKLSNSQINSHDDLILNNFKGKGKPARVIEITGEGSIPLRYDKEFEISHLNAGVYTCIPSLTPSLSKNWKKELAGAGFITFRVSDIAILSTNNSNEPESGHVYVVNAHDQQPLEGATVTCYATNSDKQIGRWTTNKDGFVKVPDGYYRFEARYANSIARRDLGFSYYPNNQKPSMHASILTDLALYRPGDTVKFAVMGWLQDNIYDSLIKERQIEVTLRDPNWAKVGEMTLTLDRNGRTNGEFVIPQGRLSGSYQINVSFPGENNASGGSAFIRVEEYKLPTFLVTLQQEENVKSDSLTFKGLAATYTGMPIGNAKVAVDILFSPWNRVYLASNAKYSLQTETGVDGEFSFSLPLQGLKGTIFEKGRYVVTAQVTSAAGETEFSTPLPFYLGSSTDIRPQIPVRTEIVGDSISFNVPVYDMAGMPIKKEIHYRIVNTSDSLKVLNGDFMSPVLTLPSDKLPSAKYFLEFVDENCENISKTETVIWRKNDMKAPFPTPLWVPETEYVFLEDQTSFRIKFGSAWPEWILYSLTDGENTIETKWIAPSDTLLSIDIPLLSDTKALFVNLAGMHDFNAETSRITLKPAKSLEKLEIETESFRENITTGDLETWKFKFNVNGLASAYTNAFAVLSDKALNSISDFKWGLNIAGPSFYDRFSMNTIRYGKSVSFRSFVDNLNLSMSNQRMVPQWNTYGYPLISSGMRIKGPVLYKAMASRNSTAEIEDGAIITENMAEDKFLTGSFTQEEENSNTNDLRPVEMPVAFFMPNLKANENGEIEIKFRVPDFNTTWQLQLAGYNEELLTATKILETVATKPVMAKSNLPQFLRTGDKAVISATLYNNSVEEEEISGKMEIIDPSSGNIIKSQLFEAINVPANGNRIISTTFIVPDTILAISIRTYAFGGSHRDGEQGIIPVLPSSAPVVDSKVFYVPASDSIMEIKIPDLSKNSRVTLKYCDNPIWDVLLSLPAMTETSNLGAISVARWLYGTLTAKEIIEGNSVISRQLSRILECEDSTLSMSPLQKDESLKITALEASPWLNSATSESIRIKNLGKYLDHDYMEDAISLKVKALGNLQQPDGGWSWFAGMKSSPFITSSVLESLGYLNRIEALSYDLESMARKGVKYYDNWLKYLFKQNKKTAGEAILDYLFTRNSFGFPMEDQMRRIKKETLDSLKVSWRHLSVTEKTKTAFLMLEEDGYHEEGSIILSSLKQYISKKLTLGEEALLLDLYNRYEPYSETTAFLRQSLLLKKETKNWGDAAESATLIMALLTSIPESQINVNSKPVISINGNVITLPEGESLTGNYTINLDPSLVSGKKLRIQKAAGLPGWGGIISQYVAPLRRVKSSKTDGLSIDKRLVVKEDKGLLKEVNSLKQGDKVTVILNVNCSKDMDYVVIKDSRGACLQPDDKISGMIFVDGLPAYREIRSDRITYFINNLPAGKHIISYNCHVDRAGEYAIGMAEVQCLYTPSQAAHGAGGSVKVNP